MKRAMWSKVLTLASGAVLLASAAEQRPVAFNRDIRPIMSDTCFRCHGPDKGSRMANLRLDIREEALKPTKSGVTPIVPGNPDSSAVVQRIFSKDARIMPPEFAHKILTVAQKEVIRRWVAEGAKYEGHWAYQPVQRPAVPERAFADSPVRNPIDAFVQERLTRENLRPAADADGRTLIRRVTLDLTGLPPTPEEVDAFLADRSPEAYEKIVDRLLASPRYAEKQAMSWLDAVRYGDTAGFHGDNILPAWPYRDYVLRAFRDNKPFDAFTREQIAGDLMPNANTEQKVASAYNRLSRMSAEGGLQPREYLAKYGADRVRTTSAVWLGATLGCAECHDHKFDPFLSKDFYSMKAFFADIKETGLVADRGVNAWGSKLFLATAEQTARLTDLDERIDQTRHALDREASNLVERRAQWEKDVLAQHEAGTLAWQYQRPLTAVSKNGAKLTIYNEEPIESNFYTGGNLVSERKPGGGVIAAGGPNPDNDTYTMTLRPGAGTWTELGIDVHQDESLPGSRVARGADRFLITEIDAELAGAKLPFVLATSDKFGEMPENGAMAAIDGDPKTGWGQSFGESVNPFLALRFAQKLTTTADSVLTIRLHQDSGLRRATVGRFRIALSAAGYSWPESGKATEKSKSAKPDVATLNIATDRGLPPNVIEALHAAVGDRTEKQERVALDYFEWAAPELEWLTARLAGLQYQRDLLQSEVERAMVTEAATPSPTRILPRADWMNESNALVTPAIPGFLGKLDTPGRRANRLDLANWIVSPDNPLTARVFVNRTWREFFGTGLSKTLEDFGSQGEWPTHLELLDWLAADFMETWDVKHLIRTIVTSHTYRQTSLVSPDLQERDPENRLLARQSRFRMDAEIVHDIALSASGLLVEKFGGPSVKPYQPDGYYGNLNFPKREYSASHGDDLYRRGVYTVWQRTFLHPTLAAFDAPTREECTVNRVNSNTPLQALVLLNDPIFVEAARVFAQNIVANGGANLDQRIDWAFNRALSRPASPQEKRILTGLYTKAQTRFRTTPDAAQGLIKVGESPLPPTVKPQELAAMTMVARAILNLHETITRN